MESEKMTLAEFCAATASSAPAPGGGGVAALTGALAAALSEMVAQLTRSKKGYETVCGEMDRAIADAAVLREELLGAIERDRACFTAYMDALSLPKATDTEKECRAQALQQAAKFAAEAPLAAAESAAKVLPIAACMVRLGNKNLVTDGLISAMLARTAVQSALLNVKINLGSIKDAAYTDALRQRITMLEADAIRQEAAVLALSPFD